MAAAKGLGSAGFGAGVDGKGSGGVGLTGGTQHPVIQVKRKETPQFFVVSKEKGNKRATGGDEGGPEAKRAKAEDEDEGSGGEGGLKGLLGDYGESSDDE